MDLKNQNKLVRSKYKVSFTRKVYLPLLCLLCSYSDCKNPDKRLLDLEMFIERNSARSVNMTSLLSKYNLICPLQVKCGDFGDVTSDTSLPVPECNFCSCNHRCVDEKTCCPDYQYGYLEYEKINVIQFPPDKTKPVSMLATCPIRVDTNARFTCITGALGPVTAMDTGITFKNIHCAHCHSVFNLTTWNLELQCPPYTPDDLYNVSSFKEFKVRMLRYSCLSIFQLPNPVRYIDISGPSDNAGNHLVDRCNVTEMWQLYDADVDWACQHLKSTFLTFKNVFCYICNPSILPKNDRTVIIDQCNVTGKSDEIDTYAEDMCLSEDSIDRLFPFKNVYCMFCNGLHSYQGSYAFFTPTKNVSLIEKYIYTKNENKILSDMSLDIAVSGDVYSGLGTLFTAMQRNQFITNQNRSERKYVNKKDIHHLLGELKSVCGEQRICKSSFKSNDSASFDLNPTCKLCRCDPMCAEDDQCCQDILLEKLPYKCRKSDEVIILPRQSATFHLHSVLNNPNYVVIDRCITPADKGLRMKCEGEEALSDILTLIPVLHMDEHGLEGLKIAYKNVYCLLCSVEHPRNALVQLRWICDVYIEPILMPSLEDLLKVAKDFCKTFFVPSSKQCQGDEHQLYKHQIEIKKQATFKWAYFPYEQSNLDPLLTTLLNSVYNDHSKGSLIPYDKCNITGTYDRNYSAIPYLCENTTDENMLALDIFAGLRTYKNFACFICNPDLNVASFPYELTISECNKTGAWENYDSVDAERTETLCMETSAEPYWLPFKNLYCRQCNLPPSFIEARSKYDVHFINVDTYRIVFSLLPHVFNTEEDDNSVADCVNGVYNSGLDRCLEIHCPTGSLYIKDQCQHINIHATNRAYNLRLYLTKPTKDAVNTGADNKRTSLISFRDIFQGIVDEVKSVFVKEGTEVQFDKTLGAVDTECVSEDDKFSFTSFTYIRLTSHIVISETNNITHTENILESLLKHEYKFKTTNDDIVKLESRPYIDGHFTVGCTTFYLTPPTRQLILQSPNLREGRQDTEIKEVNGFLNCPRIKIPLENITIDSTAGSAVLRNGNATFTPNEFKSDKENIIVCLKTYHERLPKRDKLRPLITQPSVMAKVYRIFSLICSVLSLLGLCATIIVYCLLKQLRTEPGKNNLVLCCCLFFAQLFLQFGLTLKNTTSLCVSMGVCIHFFWLATFCSMNVCCFHMFKVFYLQELQLSVPTKRWRYMAYTFGLPTTTIGITVLVHLVSSDMAFSGYAKSICFLSDIYTIIGSFFLPVTIICISNIIFFIITACKIWSQPTVQSTANANRRHFLIYIKLFSLLGITWPLQFVDSALDLSVLSFFVVALNASQGVCICLSYVCNARVYQQLRQKFNLATDKYQSDTGDRTVSTYVTENPKQ